jgi:hypothetical protein
LTRYKSARIVASILAAIGWLLTALCLLVLILSLVRVLPPILALISWLPLLAGAIVGLLVVLGSHLARAFFDIADAKLG